MPIPNYCRKKNEWLTVSKKHSVSLLYHKQFKVWVQLELVVLPTYSFHTTTSNDICKLFSNPPPVFLNKCICMSNGSLIDFTDVWNVMVVKKKKKKTSEVRHLSFLLPSFSAPEGRQPVVWNDHSRMYHFLLGC